MLAGWWLVSGVSGEYPSSIVLLAIENVLPLLVDDGRHWASLEGRVRGLLNDLSYYGLSFSCPNSKLPSQFSEGSKRVLSQRTLAKQGKKHTEGMSFVKRIASYSCHAVCRRGAGWLKGKIGQRASSASACRK